jgi:hypothetical protein
MKRFWLVLLSLGLIVAFSTSAMAVDVKFSGEYYAAGVYIDKASLAKNSSLANTSTAFFFQRLRLSTTFIVHPGLMLITRADIMERAWGAKRSDVPLVTANDQLSAGTRAENENIAFDLLYAMYISPVGIFLAGYQIDGKWGTEFGDSGMPTPKIGYMFRGGPVTLGLQTGKAVSVTTENAERSRTAILATNAVDRDDNFVTAYGIFAWKTGQVGLLAKYFMLNGNRNVIGNLAPATAWGDTGVATKYLVLSPYIKTQLGPVALQSQFYWLYGKQKWEGQPDTIPLALGGPKRDVDMNAYSFWVDALGDFGMFYAGGTLAYMSGDDPDTADKAEGGLSGGLDWNPCLIMFNNERTYWAGSLGGYDTTANGSAMTNAYFGQLRVGVRPVDKLDIMASVSYAHADKTLSRPTWEGRDYGYEVDLTATYKITNNLSYMLGGGYLFVGKYYKGSTSANNDLQNNFLVINKLTLTF